MAATAARLDMTNVKDGVQFSKKHYKEGDYKAKVIKVEDAKPKDKKDKAKMWLFTIKVNTGTYPYYCKQVENQLWKVRNLMTAAGLPVPKKKTLIDPNKAVNKIIAVTLEDAEYEGKAQSEIAAVFPLSELDEDDDDDDDDDEDEDDDEEEEDDEEDDEEEDEDDDEEEEDEDDEEEDEEEDEEDEEEDEEPVVKKKKKTAATKPVKKTAAKKTTKKKKRKSDDDDDDLDEIDIDDV